MTHCKDQESAFLVLNKKSAWERGLLVNLGVTDDGLEIREGFEYTEENEIEFEELTGGFAVTDFAVGACGLLYILDRSARAIWLYDVQQKRIERLPCLGALFSEHTTGIVYVPGTLYLTDAEAEHRIVALAEINWQIRWTVGATLPSKAFERALAGDFAPIDLAVDRQGNLYALDAKNGAIVRFDEAGRLTSVFGREALNGLQPVALAISRDGALYVLDASAMKVLKFQARDEGAAQDAEFILFRDLISEGVLPADFVPSGIGVDAAGSIFVGDGRARAAAQEDDRFVRRFDATGAYAGEVAGFRGQVERMVVGGDDWIYIFNNEETTTKKIVILRPEEKFSRLAGTTLVKGRYFSKALDSADSSTSWHKYVFNADVPANTQVQVSYFAADDKQVFVGDRKQNLDDFIDEAMEAKGKQQEKLVGLLDRLAWSTPVVNSKDALLRRDNAGRFLWLRLELIGSEKASPLVRSIRVDFPRSSYLRYLPAVYQEDERSRDFLERFLALFETFFGGLEHEIDHIARYFDAASSNTSGEYLRWLSSWLAIAADKSWSEETLRALVVRAPELYRKRGTREGLEEIIEIFTGDRPLIVEHFQRRCAHGEGARTGDPAGDDLERLFKRLYGDDPYCFCVLLKPFQVRTEEERKTIRRLLDAERPAHTCASMLVLQPWIHLDMHTYMGINTYLSQPSARLDAGGAMPRDTVLDDADNGGQLERQSRLAATDITLT